MYLKTIRDKIHFRLRLSNNAFFVVYFNAIMYDQNLLYLAPTCMHFFEQVLVREIKSLVVAHCTRDLIHTHSNSYPCFITCYVFYKIRVQMFFLFLNSILTYIKYQHFPHRVNVNVLQRGSLKN